MGHGVGVVLVSPDDQCIPLTTRLGFDCTNNMAEYEACALGIQAAIDFDVKLLKVYGDSALVIRQLRGEWETRDPKLILYQTHILKLAECFDDISFHHIPQEENQMADALATLANNLNSYTRSIFFLTIFLMTIMFKLQLSTKLNMNFFKKII